MTISPVAVDLFCGLGGWTEGLIAEGYECTGYDIEAHDYDEERYPGNLILRDVAKLHGCELAYADLIVASPPCQEFSYMAMPWERAKQIARAMRGEDVFPEGYKGSRTITKLTALFDACFRIQREASEAAGRHVPMVVENVRGAEPWVGRAKWNFGSYYLWGDVPALMPQTIAAQKHNPDGTNHGTGSWFAIADSKDRGQKNDGGSWFNIGSPGQKVTGNNPDGRKNPGFRFDGSGRSFQSESVDRHVAPNEGFKSKGLDWSNPAKRGQDFTRIAGAQAQVAKGMKQPARVSANAPADGRKGAGAGAEWFDQNISSLPSGSQRRKAASARIAKIPFALSSWIGRTYKPARDLA